MSYELIKLPVDLGEAPKVLLDYYTGTLTDHWEVAHAGLHLAAFALGQVHNHQLKGATDCPDGKVLSDDEFKATLESLTANEGIKTFGAVDWKSVLLTVAQLLLKLLA